MTATVRSTAHQRAPARAVAMPEAALTTTFVMRSFTVSSLRLGSFRRNAGIALGRDAKPCAPCGRVEPVAQPEVILDWRSEACQTLPCKVYGSTVSLQRPQGEFAVVREAFLSPTPNQADRALRVFSRTSFLPNGLRL